MPTTPDWWTPLSDTARQIDDRNDNADHLQRARIYPIILLAALRGRHCHGYVHREDNCHIAAFADGTGYSGMGFRATAHYEMMPLAIKASDSIADPDDAELWM